MNTLRRLGNLENRYDSTKRQHQLIEKVLEAYADVDKDDNIHLKAILINYVKIRLGVIKVDGHEVMGGIKACYLYYDKYWKTRQDGKPVKESYGTADSGHGHWALVMIRLLNPYIVKKTRLRHIAIHSVREEDEALDATRFANVERRKCRDPTTQDMVLFTVERNAEEVERLKQYLFEVTGKEYHIPDSTLHEGGRVLASAPPPPKRAFNAWSG